MPLEKEPSRRRIQSEKPLVYANRGKWVFYCPVMKQFLGDEEFDMAIFIAGRCAVWHYKVPQK